MPRRRNPIVLALLACASAGCWVLSADLDLSGNSLDGEGDAAIDRHVPRGPDGEPLPVEEIEGGVEKKDTGTPEPDSGGPGGFCVGTHTLCDDFNGATAGAKWTKVAQDQGGAVALASTHVKSAPTSLKATLPSACTQSSGQVVLTRPGAPSNVKIAFDVHVVAITGSGSVNLAGIEYLVAGGSFRIDVALRQGKLTVDKNHIGGSGFSVLQTAAAALATGKFVHVDIELAYGSDVRAIVKVDGASALDTTTANVAAAGGAQTNFDFGVYADNSCNAATEIHFDDVVYDLTTR